MSQNPWEPARGDLGPPPGFKPRAVVVRRVGVLSLAKVSAAISLIFGLIFGAIYFLAMLLGLAAFGARGNGAAGVGVMIGGLVALVLITLLYALFGFLSGAIAAIVYNAAAGMFGGLELELDNTSPLA